MHDKEFWLEFFQIYKELPALWRVKSPRYNNRSFKASCYTRLVRKLKEIEPEANRKMVVKKINNFRTLYRIELKKVQEANKAGKVYKSSLWYFDFFSFLSDQDDNEETKSVCEDSNTDEEKLTEDVYANPKLSPATTNHGEAEAVVEENNAKEEKKVAQDVSLTTKSQGETNSVLEENNYTKEGNQNRPPAITSPKKYLATTTKRPVGPKTKANIKKPLTPAKKRKLMQSNAKDRLINCEKNTQIDADILAKSWALQYREIYGDQKLIVRKMMTDILFHGCMGTLNMSHAREVQRILLPESSINSHSHFKRQHAHYDSKSPSPSTEQEYLSNNSPADYNTSNASFSPAINDSSEFRDIKIKCEKDP